MTGTREAFGVFNDRDALEDAVAELETTMFAHHDITISKEAAEKCGTMLGVHETTEFGPRRGTIVHEEERNEGLAAIVGGGVYIGLCAAAILAGAFAVPIIPVALAGATIGGMIGLYLARLTKKAYRHNLKNRIEEGGMMVWVRTPSMDQEEAACSIMARHGASPVGIHATGSYQDSTLNA